MNRTEFWQRVDSSGGPDACWPWMGARSGNGYGGFHLEGRMMTAHRAALILSGTQIPDDYDACHRCDNRICVNPSHLFAGTRRDNMRDAQQKRRVRWVPAPGSVNGNAKLSEADIPVIHRMAAEGRSQRFIAREFGVSQRLIQMILSGQAWAHVLRPDAVSPKAVA